MSIAGSDAALGEFLLREICDFGSESNIGRCRSTCVVDDVLYAAISAQANRNHVVKFDVGIVRDFNGPGHKHTRIVKDAVDAKAPGFMTGHSAGYLVGSPAVDAGCARIAGLVRRVVGNL